MYGLDYIEAVPAIYEIHPVGVAREDKVVTGAGKYVVVAFAGDDFVVAASTSDRIVAAATVEVVVPVGPHERIVAGGAGKDLSQGFLPGEERCHHHYHHR